MKTIDNRTVSSLYPDFGSIIKIDNINKVDNEEAELLREKLYKDQLLIVKAKTLHPKEQIQFSKIFGDLETFPYNPSQFKEFPEIFRLSTDIKKGYKNVGFYWHQDGSFNQMPTPISIFHLTEIPKSGGATLFANAQKVYNLLPTEMKKIALHLKTQDRGGAIHDVVITHPITNKKAIYLNFGLTDQIFATNNTKREDIKNVITKIAEIIELPDVKYTHNWQKGDTVIIDNYAVFHKATAIQDNSIRTLHRTTVKGKHMLNR